MEPDNRVALWDDAHRYSPAPRHRRRLILRWVRQLDIADCLDAGCAQPYLLDGLRRLGLLVYGCDISAQVIEQNRLAFPGAEFESINLAKETWPGSRQFDLVIASEVLEHIEDWRTALKNLTAMSVKYVLITVPHGRIRSIDRRVGHYRHFQGEEICKTVESYGFTVVKARRWGWPFHSLYKDAMDAAAPDRIYESFGESRYGLAKKLLSNALFLLFFVNDVFRGGDQLLVLAKRRVTFPLQRQENQGMGGRSLRGPENITPSGMTPQQFAKSRRFDERDRV